MKPDNLRLKDGMSEYLFMLTASPNTHFCEYIRFDQVHTKIKRDMLITLKTKHLSRIANEIQHVAKHKSLNLHICNLTFSPCNPESYPLKDQRISLL